MSVKVHARRGGVDGLWIMLCISALIARDNFAAMGIHTAMRVSNLLRNVEK